MSLIFYSIYAIFNKIFYSIKLVKSLLIITAIGIILKIIFNYLLVKPLSQDGLALSSSLSYFIFFIISFFYLINKLKLSGIYTFITELLFILFNASISYSLTALITHTLLIDSLFMRMFSIFLFFVFYTLNMFLINHSIVKYIKNIYYNLFNLSSESYN